MAHLLEVCPSPYQPQLVNIKHELTAVLLFSQMEMVLKIAEKKKYANTDFSTTLHLSLKLPNLLGGKGNFPPAQTYPTDTACHPWQ